MTHLVTLPSLLNRAHEALAGLKKRKRRTSYALVVENGICLIKDAQTWKTELAIHPAPQP